MLAVLVAGSDLVLTVSVVEMRLVLALPVLGLDLMLTVIVV